MSLAVATKRAVGYIRVSTADQAGERHISLETQDARIGEYCRRESATLVGTYMDVLSWRSDDRSQYLAMVDHVLQGGAELVVVQFLDRFGRNPREILRRIWELQDKGIEVVATDEDIREELVLLVRAGLAGAESKRTSERVTAYMKTSASKGMHFGRPPYGYRSIKHGETIAWEQEPDEAAAVREMYRLSVEENRGFKAIGDLLFRGGYPTRGGRPWAAYSVQHILKNEAIAGTLVYGKKPKAGGPPAELVRVPDFFPAILSPEEWESLQKRLARRLEAPRGRTHSSEFLLSGIARCGHCGGPMVGKHSGLHNGRRHRKYACSWAQRSQAKCAFYNSHSTRRLEGAILEHLGRFSDPEEVRRQLEAADGQAVDRSQEELTRLDKRLVELERDFQQNLDLLKRGVLNDEEFMRANEARRDERAVLTGRREELEEWVVMQRDHLDAVASLPPRIGTLIEDVQTMDVRRAKAMLQDILRAAHVYRDGRIELSFRT